MSTFTLDLQTFHNHLRNLAGDEVFYDLRIKCDGGVILANQLVMASGSKVFRHALTKPDGKGGGGRVAVAIADKKGPMKTVKVKGIPSRAMRNVARFLARGSIGFVSEVDGDLDEFVEAAVALKVKGICREKDVVDLDLTEASTPPLIDKNADTELLFDNETALSEAVTQAFEVLSRPGTGSNSGGGSSSGGGGGGGGGGGSSGGSIFNGQSLLIGEPSKTDAYVTDLNMISAGGSGSKKEKNSTATKEPKSRKRKQSPQQQQQPAAPRRRQQQQAPVRKKSRGPPAKKQPKESQKPAAKKPPQQRKSASLRPPPELIPPTAPQEKWLPMPAPEDGDSADPDEAEMRARRLNGISGAFWQCDKCEFWHYHKHGMKKHLDTMH